MRIDEQRVVNAVELYRRADRRIDQPRIAFERRGVTADAIEAIERPDRDIVGSDAVCAD